MSPKTTEHMTRHQSHDAVNEVMVYKNGFAADANSEEETNSLLSPNSDNTILHRKLICCGQHNSTAKTVSRRTTQFNSEN
jgi:hypothetical protein